MKIALFLLTILSFLSPVFGQGESNIWKTGFYTFDFNTPQLTFTTDSGNFIGVKVATRSDEQGNLLFYTNGCTIWDKNGVPLQNGLDIGDTTGYYCQGLGFLYQSGAATRTPSHLQIVPNPANANQYFVFSNIKYSGGNTFQYGSNIVYSIVDMTLNNGIGGVVPASKNTVIVTSAQNFRFTGVTKGNCDDFWYIIASNENVYASNTSTTFSAYHIGEDGLINPTCSYVGAKSLLAALCISSRSGLCTTDFLFVKG